jgi:hypothetical protein
MGNRINTVFSSTMLEEHAEELGIIKREGNVYITALVWALVFGFAATEG